MSYKHGAHISESTKLAREKNERDAYLVRMHQAARDRTVEYTVAHEVANRPITPSTEVRFF